MEAQEKFMSFDISNLPNPPMPSYTFAIYSRDLFEKSKFKDYDSLLKNKFARSQARAKHFASIIRNGNVMAANGTHERKRDRGGRVLKKTEVSYFFGEHVGAFTLGSQKIPSYLLVDTGSDLVWWQCGPCVIDGCYEQRNNPLYVSTDSTTHRAIDCVAESALCQAPNDPKYTCLEEDKSCRYDYSYADGARTRGWIAEDVITFGDDQSQPKLLFGCSNDQRGTRPFSGEYAGIAGLGRRSNTGVGYSLPTQFQSDIMAICLPGSFTLDGGSLTFHTSPFKRDLSAKLVPNSVFPNFYFVDFYKILINGQEVPVDPSAWQYRPEWPGGCVVDTGTLYTVFPRDYYTIFRNIYRYEARNYERVEIPGVPFDTCYKGDPSVVRQSFPIVFMYFGDSIYNVGRHLYLLSHQVMVRADNIYCLAFMPSDQKLAVIGAHQLQGVGLTFDTGANTLYFDPNGCSF